MRLSTCVIAGAVCLTLGASARGSDGTLDPTLARARAFADTWKQQFSGLVLEEVYTQHVERRFEGGLSLRLRSDVLLVRVDNLWVGFRDIAEVEGQAIAGREQRLLDLFVTRPLEDALRQARRLLAEGARYNLGSVYRNFNVPTTALRILEPERASRVDFRLERKPEDEDDPVVVVSFRERRAPTVIMTLNRDYVFARGRLWIEPATGRIRQTELQWRLTGARDSGELEAKVTVSYGLDEAANVWVPTEMVEEYRTPNQVISCRATYGNVRRFTVSVQDEVGPGPEPSHDGPP